MYHLAVKPISRSEGRSSVAAAAYRSGERLYDERTGLVHDYSRKGGVLATGLLGWAGERESLWQAAEAAERRKDARVAREVEVALPAGMTVPMMHAMVTGMGTWLRERYGVAVDFAIHAPGRHGDDRNYHAHVMMTTRACNGQSLAKTKVRILDDLKTGPEEVEAIRAMWAERCQAVVAEDEREKWDHRSYVRRGIEMEPTVHEGPTVREIERRERRDAEAEGSEYEPVTERARDNAEVFDRRALQNDLREIEEEIKRREAEATEQERITNLNRLVQEAAATERAIEKLHKEQNDYEQRKREILTAADRAADEANQKIDGGVGGRAPSPAGRRSGVRRAIAAIAVVAAAAKRRIVKSGMGFGRAQGISSPQVSDKHNRGLERDGWSEMPNQRRERPGAGDVGAGVAGDAQAAPASAGRGLIGRLVAAAKEVIAAVNPPPPPSMVERMAATDARIAAEIAAEQAGRIAPTALPAEAEHSEDIREMDSLVRDAERRLAQVVEAPKPVPAPEIALEPEPETEQKIYTAEEIVGEENENNESEGIKW